METMCSTMVPRALYSGFAGRFTNNFFSSLPYGNNLDLSCPTRRVNRINPIGRFWHLLCNLDRVVVYFRPYCLMDENLDVNADGIFAYCNFMA
jgi:hypothetical protein